MVCSSKLAGSVLAAVPAIIHQSVRCCQCCISHKGRHGTRLAASPKAAGMGEDLARARAIVKYRGSF
jgi:hypothetical protein